MSKIVTGYEIRDGIAYETPEHKQQRLRRELAARLRTANLPESIIKYDIDKDYLGEKSIAEVSKIKKVLEWCTSKNPRQVKYKQLARKSMYYVFGPNGTQKTHVTWWLAKELVRKGESVYYTTMQAILQDLTNLESNRDTDSEIYRRIEKYKSVQFLFIDESFDKSKVTMYKSKFQIPFLDDLIRSRVHSGKAIIFISNNKYDDIESFADQSIADFVYRNVSLTGTNFVFEDVYIKNIDKYDGRELITLF